MILQLLKLNDDVTLPRTWDAPKDITLPPEYLDNLKLDLENDVI